MVVDVSEVCKPVEVYWQAVLVLSYVVPVDVVQQAHVEPAEWEEVPMYPATWEVHTGNIPQM